MKQYFSELYTGGKSLVEGLARHHEGAVPAHCYGAVSQARIQVTTNYRGHIDLVLDPEENRHICA